MLFLHLFFLVLLNHYCQAGDVFISLSQEVRQTLVLLLVNQLAIALFIFSLRVPKIKQEQSDTKQPSMLILLYM